MVDFLKQRIKDVLKIPPEPEAPFGASGSLRIFRAAPGYLRYRMLHWTWRQISVVAGIVAFFYILSFDPGEAIGRIQEQLDQHAPFAQLGMLLTLGNLFALLEILAVAGFVLQLPFTFLMVFLDYEYRWYIITDRSLRIREGLMRVEERTMTFSNIQNVSVHQGPLQRFLGISDLEVSSAGGGGASSSNNQQDSGTKNLHRAYFRGIANPAEIREAILTHLKTLKASGLGDPDEDSAPHTHPTTLWVPTDPDGRPTSPDAQSTTATPAPAALDLLAAARSVLQETQALRRALS